MKRFLHVIGWVALSLAVLSCSLGDDQSTPEGYVRHCVRLLDRQALYAATLYVHTVLDFLQENRDAQGVILDLRDNFGGNMYPMIAAVSPLLPDGVILRFKSRTRPPESRRH